MGMDVDYIAAKKAIEDLEKLLSDQVQYGCAVLNIDWFTASANRHIRELTLSSGVKITETQMTEIRNYLKFNKY